LVDIAAEKICNQNTSLSYNILFIYSIENQESVNVVIRSRNSWSNAAASSSRRTIFFSQLVQQFIQSPQSPTFIRKFLNKLFAP